MEFLERIFGAVSSAIYFHLLRYREVWVGIVIAVLVCGAGLHYGISAPGDFPNDTIVVIAQGSAAPEVSATLERARVVRSAAVLRFVLRITGESAHIHSGAYRFTEPESVFMVARRISSGSFGIPPIRLTIIEGNTVRDMAAKVAAAFPEITAPEFLAAGQPYEGYLFPDTYFFPPDASAKSMVAVMRANFANQTAALSDTVAASGQSLGDIVTMASLVEKEARSSEAKHMVAGILWNRIKKNMPLQVDAVFGYIFGRDTYSPSFADLGVDSPYNTYTHRGLPPGPIDSPGLTSLDAALHPTKSSYLFYLTGKDGQMHYAKTYTEQLTNQRKYLK